MSCRTGYLLRDVDGSCRYAAVGHGDWLIVDRDRLTVVRGWIGETGAAVGDVAAGAFDDACCQGVVLDARNRRYRFFPCRLRGARCDEIVERVARRAPLWQGWDVGLARGGRDELAALVPEAADVVARYAWPTPSLDDLALGGRDAWFAGWRPDTATLCVREDEASADWYDDGCSLVTVVGADLRVRDYRLRDGLGDLDGLLPWFAHGPRLLDVLGAAAPFPPPSEALVDAGAVLDVGRRAVRYWGPRIVPPGMVDRVRAAWPGWEVGRLAYGLAGHLAATGRRRPELLDDRRWASSPVAALAGRRDLAEAWDAERRSLPLDPRPLSRPRIVVAGS